MHCTKAIIPVAGYGTRRLPVTKAIEKCMLPIGNRPWSITLSKTASLAASPIFSLWFRRFEQLKKYYSAMQSWRNI